MIEPASLGVKVTPSTAWAILKKPGIEQLHAADNRIVTTGIQAPVMNAIQER
jgi:hypothetical protein